MDTFLLIGLGNPGTRYAHNRHNIGFMAVDAIAQKHSFSAWSQKFQGLCCEGTVPSPTGGRLGKGLAGSDSANNAPLPSSRPSRGEARVYLLKPQTFMNLSGESVGALARFYKIPLENIIVLHDELDLPLAKVRVKLGGGHGGHNGLKSLDAHLGADYWRVRMGIGHPGDKELVSPYVLSDFSKQEQQLVEKLTAAIAEHIYLLFSGNEAEFMNRVVLGLQTP